LTDFIVCDTQADAQTAMRQIDDAMSFSDPRTMTDTWAAIETRATDGKSVFIAPPVESHTAITVPYTIEEMQDDWFPTVEIEK